MTTPASSSATPPAMPYVPSSPTIAPLPPAPGLAANFAQEANPSQAYAQDLYQASFGLTPAVMAPASIPRELEQLKQSVHKQNGVFGWLYNTTDVILTPFKVGFGWFKQLVGITPKPPVSPMATALAQPASVA